MPDSPSTDWQLRKLFERAINPNQRLILSVLKTNPHLTFSGLAEDLWKERRKAVSTTKLNANVLHDLGLIAIEHHHAIQLTEFGKRILDILGEGSEERISLPHSRNKEVLI